MLYKNVEVLTGGAGLCHVLREALKPGSETDGRRPVLLASYYSLSLSGIISGTPRSNFEMQKMQNWSIVAERASSQCRNSF